MAVRYCCVHFSYSNDVLVIAAGPFRGGVTWLHGDYREAFVEGTARPIVADSLTVDEWSPTALRPSVYAF